MGIVHTLHSAYYDYYIHTSPIEIRHVPGKKSKALTSRKFVLTLIYNTFALLENRRHACDTKTEL